MSFITLSDLWKEDVNVNGTILALNQSISKIQPSKQIKKIKFQSDGKLNEIPQILICIGKNALEYAYSVLDNTSVKLKKVIVFQANGYEPKVRKQSSILTLYLVDHPIPNQDNIKHSEQFISYLNDLEEIHRIHFIITGGTSSCLSLSENEVKFSEYIEIIKSSIAGGLNIFQLNEIRSTIDQLKAGKLSILLKNHFVKTWVISDILTNEAKFVGSGPTIPGIILGREAKIWLKSIVQELKISINLQKLETKLTEVAKYNNPNHNWSILLSNIDFSRILLSQIKKIFGTTRNYKLKTTEVQEDVIAFATTVYQSYLQLSQPTILIWMGELTTKVSNEILDKGKGGRLSYFSLLISKLFKNSSDALIISVATDGQDGSSPKSCYIVNDSTHNLIINVDNFESIIQNGNTGLIFDKIGSSLKINQTNINLADVIIMIKN